MASKVRKAQSQKDEGHEKQEVEKEMKKKVKAETLKANEIEGNESETQSQDVKAEVRMVEDQNEGNENLQTPNKDLKTNNAELQLSKSDDLKKTKPEPEKQSVEISTPKEELEKNEVMTPDMLKKKQKTSSLKLDLAVTRRNKLEDTVDQFFSGKNQSMENELDNLKRTLHAREKELERFKWLRNYLIYEIPESFSQLKFKLAISRVQKVNTHKHTLFCNTCTHNVRAV
ncbi:WEB family protein At4g27595, chloroplastic-like [Haplochromis burtoni]|uniref:WEB family protein At4g27595, chloroplastic-like n=1 Tax=Haplochromis burtoni TaxID=8153 RepID=UPI001C2D9434|nr:WEB family protein At4g27595, chloroplastic-like [Haplochromis burtoni]